MAIPLIDKLRKAFSFTSNVSKSIAPSVNITNPVVLSNQDLEKHYKNIFVSSSKNVSHVDSPILSYIQPIQSMLVKNKIDNEKLYEIAPEIENATTILVPSILSPNTLQQIEQINITINNNTLKDSTKKAIIELLSNHFNNNLQLYKKLDKWIEKALIKEGALPILILPPSVIQKIREDSIGSGVESLSDVKFNSNKMIELAKKDILINNSNSNLSFESLLDNEIDSSLHSEIVSSLFDNDLNSFLKVPMKEKNINISSEAIKKVVKVIEDDESVIVSNNPEVLAYNKISKTNSLNRVYSEYDKFLENKQIKTKMKKDAFIDISSYLSSGDIGNYPYPIIEELPMESVIPITTKNNPSEHIGYFLLLDSDGDPVKIDATDEEFNNLGSSHINSLFKTMRGNTHSNITQQVFNTTNFKSSMMKDQFYSNSEKSVVNKVINSYVDITLRKAIMDSGIKSFDIKLNNDIMSLMFSRILQRKKTIILFIPKTILFYLTYMYNKNGTGRSKLENIKFPLALKMTFMITKLLSMIESAIIKKRIEVELDEDKGLNHLEILRTVKNRLIQSKLSGFTYDPSKIIRSVVDKEYSIVPKNIPGVSNFSISEEDKQSSSIRPDDSLFEEINNMYILGLDVPPSALNQLGENEFSRSVATNNFFFTNKIIKYQSITVNFLSEILSIYTKYSKTLRDGILELIKKDIKVTEKEKEIDKDDEKDIEETALLNQVINDIRIMLPSPKIVYDKAMYEEIDKYINMVKSIIDEIYPDGMVGDRDLDDFFAMYKANAKAGIIKKYFMDTNSLIEFDIEDIGDFDISDVIKTKQTLMHFSKALKDLKEKLNTEEESNGGY